MKNKQAIALGLVTVLFAATVARPHCQIPCGIYGDETRFELLAEHITTIEKSMNEIVRLTGETEQDYNQIVRWVNNKDQHADEFAHIVTYYFMAQRVKPVEKEQAEAYQDYQHKITLLHEMLLYAMKAKQTTDLAHVEKLRSLLADFRTAYLGPESEQKPKK